VWSPRIPTRYLPHGTWEHLIARKLEFRLPGYHGLWPTIPCCSTIQISPLIGPATPTSCDIGLDCSAFARRLLTESFQFLFLLLLRCFSSERSLPAFAGSSAKQSGFPHSDTTGSALLGSSPVTIVATYVLRRINTPRHPLFALMSKKYGSTNNILLTFQSTNFVSAMRIQPRADRGIP
jgi:hypothetical protein